MGVVDDVTKNPNFESAFKAGGQGNRRLADAAAIVAGR